MTKINFIKKWINKWINKKIKWILRVSGIQFFSEIFCLEAKRKINTHVKHTDHEDYNKNKNNAMYLL